MHPMLNIAVKAARRAGQIINRASLDTAHLQVSMKQQSDFVTEVDRAAEEAIIDILRASYPDHAFLAEESGISGGKDSSGGKDRDKNQPPDYEWIIDPLDGTTNFIHGVPQYAVSIALRQRGVLQHGVVYDVNRNEIFTASKGAGAFVNNQRIRVSARVKLADALIGTGFPYRVFDRVDVYLAIFKELAQKTAGLRRPGAASLDLAWVAAGRTDGFFEFGLSPWDMAAGALLILEAGGLVGGLTGEADYLATGDLVAGAPKIFSQLLHVISGHCR